MISPLFLIKTDELILLCLLDKGQLHIVAIFKNWQVM